MLLDVRQGAAPVDDFVIGYIDAVGLVGRLASTEYVKKGEQAQMDEWWHWKIIDWLIANLVDAEGNTHFEQYKKVL